MYCRENKTPLNCFKLNNFSPRILLSCPLSPNPGIDIAAVLTFAGPKEVKAKAINSATYCPLQDKAR